MQQSQRVLATYMNKLQNPNSQMRLRAVRSIIRQKALQGQAFILILPLLNDPDEKVCQGAVRALNSTDPHRARPELMRTARQHANPRIRILALQELVENDAEQAWPEVWSALQDHSAIVRKAAINIIGWSGGPQDVTVLLPLLNERLGSIRARVIRAMARIDLDQATEHFIAALNDRAAEVRLEAVRALNTSEVEQGIRPLKALLHDPHGQVRSEVINTLGKRRSEEACRPLLNLLHNQETAQATRITIIRALSCSGNPLVVEALLALINEPQAVMRSEIVAALSQQGDRRATEPLCTLLADPDLTVRIKVIEGPGRLQDRRSLEPLVSQLNDANPQIRWRVVEALERLNDPQAIESLMPLLHDADTQTRRRTQAILNRLLKRNDS